MRLKQQLSEAQKEINDLSYKYLCGGGGGGGGGGGAGGEFSSSASTTAYSMNEGYSAAWGEFEQAAGGGMDGYNNNYIPDDMTADFYCF